MTKKTCCPTYKNVARIFSGRFGFSQFSAPQNQKSNPSSQFPHFPAEQNHEP